MNKPTLNGSERRRSRRQPPKPTTELACRPETLVIGPNLALSVLDISTDGVRLIVSSRLEKGQRVEVDLEGIGYCRPLKFQGEVVWSVATADGNWCVGVTF